VNRRLPAALAALALLIAPAAAAPDDDGPLLPALNFFEDDSPAPAAAPSVSEDAPPAPVAPVAPIISEDVPPAPVAPIISNDVPPAPVAPTISEDASPAPVAPAVSEDIPLTPVAPVISNDVPPAPVAPVISEDVPPVPVPPAVSEDVPPAPATLTVSEDAPPAPVAQAVSEDGAPAPVAPIISNDAPPAPVAPVVSEDVPPAPVPPTVSEDAPPAPVPPAISENAPPAPVAPAVSEDIPPGPVVPTISEDAPPAPVTPAVSEDVPPAPVASAVSDDVPPVEMKTADGGFFTISVPGGWTQRQDGDRTSFVSPAGEDVLTIAAVPSGGRSLREFAFDACAAANGRELRTFAHGVSYTSTAPDGSTRHTRLCEHPGRAETFVVAEGRTDKAEMSVLDTLQLKAERPSALPQKPQADLRPEQPPRPSPGKDIAKRAPLAAKDKRPAPKPALGKNRTLNGTHWSMQVPSGWTMRGSGAQATVLAPRGASRIVIGSRLSTHGVPVGEVAQRQCQRHSGTDFAPLGHGVWSYTVRENGRRTHVRLYSIGSSHMVQVKITGRYDADVQKALASLRFW